MSRKPADLNLLDRLIRKLWQRNPKLVKWVERLFMVPCGCLMMVACSGGVSGPVIIPVWFVMAVLLLTNRPVFKTVWHILTVLLLLPLLLIWGNTSDGMQHRYSPNPYVKLNGITVISIIGVVLTWLWFVAPVPEAYRPAGLLLAGATAIGMGYVVWDSVYRYLKKR